MKEPEVHNHTQLSLAQIADLKEVGSCHNKWRQRHVTLYRLSPGRVISYGRTFDSSMVVIAEESDTDHTNTLAAWPRTYVHE
jgi:hypothetical protein